ncbi:MAG TPA: anhydro-N-acetylmuramic acid kinase, partial [Polyangiaceae bacterium]|nr:anhydro-N-acetylmuramic acid kinase [Polyangiaceae bacterium]
MDVKLSARSVMAIGIMSGTSADGVDAVLLELRSVAKRHAPRLIGHVHRPFPRALRKVLLEPHALDAGRIAELHFALAGAYADAARALPRYRRASVCGMHGQTIWHAPPPARTPCTLQIGSSSALSQHLGMPVVGDFRGADIALGGQGAPIVPFAHWFFTLESESPRLVVNLGGICNFTYVAKRLDDVRAYDVGPAMMLSDAFAELATEGKLAFDRDGVLSRPGRVIERIVREIAAHPFVKKKPPKSTGREDFGRQYFAPLFERHRRERKEDLARSLLAATATILADAVRRDRHIAGGIGSVVLSGGGARNPMLVEEMRLRFPDAEVTVASAGVLAPEHHEPA